MIRKVIDYIKEDNFELRANTDYISILNYVSIAFMEDEKILINHKDGSVLIKGKNLTVIKLMKSEMLIKGMFKIIEFRRNYES